MVKEKFNALFFSNDEKVGHLKALDGLRGIAVLFVLLSHSSNANLFFFDFLNFQRIGKVGVYLFFVLSAYLLDRQIALAFMKNKVSSNYWKNYCFRRFLRIYPLFFVALLLYGLLTIIGFRTVIDQIWDIPKHLLLLSGESVFWSIPVEFKYYLISPLLMWVCHKYLKWNHWKLFFMFLGLIVTAIVIERIFHLSLISTFRYFPVFIVGTFISIVELIYGEKKLQSMKSLIFEVGGVLGIVIIIITIPYYFKSIFGFGLNFHSALFFFPYALIWGVILLAAKYGGGIIKKLFELKLLRFIGSISFSVYLLHMIFLNMVREMAIPNNLKIYVFFFLTIVFSSLSFLLIERPLSNLRLYGSNSFEKGKKSKWLLALNVIRLRDKTGKRN
ncbi:acyltransferase family protein [Mangrovimonas xylaniphaga]|uniref:acyltransferase family protein n=1 Tax=Mangrovimonas xylaniphaga TaxID=1645915 RepID=UPI0006B51C95|nr:acyltransferase [Mangrovimonas xylaniphaga]